MDREAVLRYYSNYDEWGRLDSVAGRLEFQRTTQIMESFLAKGSHVLDLGGGPGRYAIHLAKTGFDVTLTDLSEKLLHQARCRIRAAGACPPPGHPDSGRADREETRGGRNLRTHALHRT